MKKLFKKLFIVLLVSCSARASFKSIANAQINNFKDCYDLQKKFEGYKDKIKDCVFNKDKDPSIITELEQFIKKGIYQGEKILTEIGDSPANNEYKKDCKAAAGGNMVRYYKFICKNSGHDDLKFSESDLINLGAFDTTLDTGSDWYIYSMLLSICQE